MESIGYLLSVIFSMIKLAVLGTFYATFFLIIFVIYNNINPTDFFNRFLKKKIKAWFKIGALTSIFILFFSFTHYGDNGFGTAQRLPLNYEREIFFSNDGTFDYSPIFIDSFIQKDEFVYGIKGTYPESRSDYKPDYFKWNLKTDEVVTFTEKEYIELFKKGEVLNANKFKGFKDHYFDYWFGWLFFITI